MTLVRISGPQSKNKTMKVRRGPRKRRGQGRR